MQLDPTRVRFLRIALLCTVSLLVGIGVVYEWTLWSKPNPWTLPTHLLPTLAESPWPTLERLRSDALPWVLDPSSTWSSLERSQGQTSCGLLHILHTRYPAWNSAYTARYTPLRKACERTGGILPEDAAPLFATDGALILEDKPTLELILHAERGLLVRRKQGTP